MLVDELADLRGEIAAEMPEHVVAVRLSTPHEIRDAEGVLVSTLEVRAAAAIGDLTLELEAAGGGQLTGLAPFGLALVAAGSSLALAQDARAEGRALRVALAAPLADVLAAGASVTLAASADFDLGQAIDQPADPARVPLDVVAPPGGELLLEARRLPEGLALRPGSTLLLSSGGQPYAEPGALAVADPAATARRVSVVASPQRIGGALSVLYGAAR